MQHDPIGMDEPRGLPLDAVTIAEQLRAHGYATHAVGKWHIGFYTWNHMPTRRGFDSYLGILCQVLFCLIKKAPVLIKYSTIFQVEAHSRTGFECKFFILKSLNQVFYRLC